MSTITEQPNIGLEDRSLTGVTDILNRTLADEVVLYIKTRNYHWNVVGPKFITLHKFFEELYEEIDEIMDETAEFTRFFGAKALTSMSSMLHNARLKECDQVPDADGMIRDLLRDNEELIRYLRKDIEQAEELEAADVADYLTGLLEKHGKMAWMLRSLSEPER